MSRWRWERDAVGFHCGWVSGNWWLSVCSIRGKAIYLDIGKVRIRWAGPAHRPLFSERYGYTKWYKIGRLGLNIKRTRVPK